MSETWKHSGHLNEFLMHFQAAKTSASTKSKMINVRTCQKVYTQSIYFFLILQNHLGSSIYLPVPNEPTTSGKFVHVGLHSCQAAAVRKTRVNIQTRVIIEENGSTPPHPVRIYQAADLIRKRLITPDAICPRDDLSSSLGLDSRPGCFGFASMKY